MKSTNQPSRQNHQSILGVINGRNPSALKIPDFLKL